MRMITLKSCSRVNHDRKGGIDYADYSSQICFDASLISSVSKKQSNYNGQYIYTWIRLTDGQKIISKTPYKEVLLEIHEQCPSAWFGHLLRDGGMKGK